MSKEEMAILLLASVAMAALLFGALSLLVGGKRSRSIISSARVQGPERAEKPAADRARKTSLDNSEGRDGPCPGRDEHLTFAVKAEEDLRSAGVTGRAPRILVTAGVDRWWGMSRTQPFGAFFRCYADHHPGLREEELEFRHEGTALKEEDTPEEVGLPTGGTVTVRKKASVPSPSVTPCIRSSERRR